MSVENEANRSGGLDGFSLDHSSGLRKRQMSEDSKTEVSSIRDISLDDFDVLITHSVPLWGLPTHQPRCLEALLALQMSGVSYARRTCHYSINPITGSGNTSLPYIRPRTAPIKSRGPTAGSPASSSSSQMMDDSSLLRSSISSYDIDCLNGERAIDSIVEQFKLNEWLSPMQRADVSSLTTLVRNSLSLVNLFELFGDEPNFKHYSSQMSRFLPSPIVTWMLSKQRSLALKVLDQHQLHSEQKARDLLSETLTILALKMNGGDSPSSMSTRSIPPDLSDASSSISAEMEVLNGSSHPSRAGVFSGLESARYFFDFSRTAPKKSRSPQPCSLDASLVAELIVLQCSQLPNKLLNESLMDDPMVAALLDYARQVFGELSEDIDQAPLVDDHEQGPPSDLRFQSERKPWFFESWFKPEFQPRRSEIGSVMEKDTRRSVLFVVGSAAALAVYLRFFQPGLSKPT